MIPLRVKWNPVYKDLKIKTVEFGKYRIIVYTIDTVERVWDFLKSAPTRKGKKWWK